MSTLNLPPFDVKTRREGDRTLILDTLRRKYVTLTPEEWVRQHFTHLLTDHKGYPPTLLQNEVELACGGKKLRCDSILFNSDGTARMILEYKAPSVAITQKVFNQISAYNTLLKVDYLVVSNGLQHFCYKIDHTTGSGSFLSDIPAYNEL